MSKVIITHCDSFHADEVLAYTMLRAIFTDHKLIRTRDPKIIETGDIVIDVGGVYDHGKGRYDHHQENCKETYTKGGIPLSSAGMVYKHYGRKYLETKLKREISSDLVYDFYKKIISEVDAIDNGVRQHKDSKFFINTNYSTIISYFNGISNNHEEQYERFMMAVKYTEAFLDLILRKANEDDLLFIGEYAKIKKLIDDTNKNYIVYDFYCHTLVNCLKKYEKENSREPIRGYIYQNEDNWRVKTVSSETYPLKVENLSNKDDLVFIHKNLFVAEAKTLESAIEIAEMSFQ